MAKTGRGRATNEERLEQVKAVLGLESKTSEDQFIAHVEKVFPKYRDEFNDFYSENVKDLKIKFYLRKLGKLG